MFCKMSAMTHCENRCPHKEGGGGHELEEKSFIKAYVLFTHTYIYLLSLLWMLYATQALLSTLFFMASKIRSLKC